jgi:hypothetical protein
MKKKLGPHPSKQPTPCLLCINFKTLTITKQNLYKFPWADAIIVNRKLKEQREVPVYFCARGLLQRDLHITPTTIRKLPGKICDKFDIPLPAVKFIHL